MHTRNTLAIAALLLTACAKQHFTRTGIDTETRPPLPKDCPVTLLQSAPTDRPFVELGLCDVSVPGGGLIADFTHKATAKLRECACSAGGNAVIFISDRETNVMGSQQSVQAKGSVLWVYPPGS